MKLTIDGQEVEAREGQTVLQAAEDAGIFIPHLCAHPDLEAVGGCRQCMVCVDGEAEPVCACETLVREGMAVEVHAPEADRVRKMAMQLILATHPADCSGCPKFGVCELQSMYQFMGVSPQGWRLKSRPVPTDESNPLITHMFTRCIRCGRCVRACREMRGVKVLDYQRTEEGIRIGTDGHVSLVDAGCRFCGACIEVCPTGSIIDVLKYNDPDKSREDNVVPCRAACPAHINVPEYLRAIRLGDYDNAASIIHERVPFPEALGRVCTHACETDCKHGEINQPVSICKEKRAAATFESGAWKKNVRHDPLTGKKVAVVGSGPAGLTAAYYLAGKGHAVTVFEANEKAGGQLRYGIPAYRMPDEALDHEIENILTTAGSGVGDPDGAPRIELRCGERVAQPKDLLGQGYDAVLVALGTHQGTVLPTKGHELDGVYVNTAFLKAAREGHPMDVTGNVVVLGGGSVAYDCARTAIRLGANEVHMACLEARPVMTAALDEIEEGGEEGVILHDAYGFDEIMESADNPGHVGGMRIKKIAKFYFDENHRAITEFVEGGDLEIPCDHVIFAVGQKPEGTTDMGFELTHGPYIVADETLATSVPGVYAAGDVVTGTKTIIGAIAQGRTAAESIDRYLGGDGDITERLAHEQEHNPFIGRRPGFGKEPRLEPKVGAADERKTHFCQYEDAFDNDTACAEANRCLQCDLRLDVTRPRLWNEY